MATFGMHMTVGEFVGLGLSHFDNFALKMKLFAGEGVVPVNEHFFLSELLDPVDDSLVLLCSLKIRGDQLNKEADLKLEIIGKLVPTHRLHFFGIILSEGIFRLEHNIKGIAHHTPFKSALQAGEKSLLP